MSNIVLLMPIILACALSAPSVYNREASDSKVKVVTFVSIAAFLILWRVLMQFSMNSGTIAVLLIATAIAVLYTWVARTNRRGDNLAVLNIITAILSTVLLSAMASAAHNNNDVAQHDIVYLTCAILSIVGIALMCNESKYRFSKTWHHTNWYVYAAIALIYILTCNNPLILTLAAINLVVTTILLCNSKLNDNTVHLLTSIAILSMFYSLILS